MIRLAPRESLNRYSLEAVESMCWEPPPSAENDRLNLQDSVIDQGLEGSELSLYTNGTCSGVRIVSRLVPAALDRCPRGFPGHVAHPSCSVRAATPKVFAGYGSGL